MTARQDVLLKVSGIAVIVIIGLVGGYYAARGATERDIVEMQTWREGHECLTGQYYDDIVGDLATLDGKNERQHSMITGDLAKLGDKIGDLQVGQATVVARLDALLVVVDIARNRRAVVTAPPDDMTNLRRN